MRIAALEEQLDASFSDNLVKVTANGPLHGTITNLSISRGKNLGLVITATSETPQHRAEVAYPAGTVRAADETIEFQHVGGGVGIARGVVYQGSKSSYSAGQYKTTQSCSAQSVELHYKCESSPTHLVEWVANISDNHVWTDRIKLDVTKAVSATIGSGDNAVKFLRSFKSGGGSTALHLHLEGFDLYVVPYARKKKKRGIIVYKGCPDQAVRDKIRVCLSFALGLPMVYYGHAEYSTDWQITFTKSVGAFSIGGLMFQLHATPPYPLDSRYSNVIDREALNFTVAALAKQYEAIKLNELSWAYWYAMCAPVHLAAVHFGALIEQLQRNASHLVKNSHGKLLEAATWKPLEKSFLKLVEGIEIDPLLAKILTGKIRGLNQAPHNIALKRLFDGLALDISEAEIEAWRHRNSSAHGGFTNTPIELILYTKILRLMFHRLLAAITYCSDRYIDYYNLHFPIRQVSDAIPIRSS